MAEQAAREMEEQNSHEKMVTFFLTGDDAYDPAPLISVGFFQKANDGPVRIDEHDPTPYYPFLPSQTIAYPYFKFLMGEPAAGHREPDFDITRVNAGLFHDQSRHNDWAFLFPTMSPSNATPSAYVLTKEEVRLIHMTPKALEAMRTLVQKTCQYFGMQSTGRMSSSLTARLLYTQDNGQCSHECCRVTRFLEFCRLVGFHVEASMLRNGLLRLVETGDIEVPAKTYRYWFQTCNIIQALI